MTTATHCPKSLLAEICGPREMHDTRESWLARGARRAGLTRRLTKSIFYGEIKDPDHRAVRLIREKLERENRAGANHETNASALRSPRDLANELDELAARIDAIRAELAARRA